MSVTPYTFTFPLLAGVGMASLIVVFGGYMLIANIYANRSAKIMENSVHKGIEHCLINCPNTENIVEDMVQRYIKGTGPKRKVGSWHSFKIRKNTTAKKSMEYLFKITQCLEVFSTLLPAVALEQYSTDKGKEALKGIKSNLES